MIASALVPLLASWQPCESAMRVVAECESVDDVLATVCLDHLEWLAVRVDRAAYVLVARAFYDGDTADIVRVRAFRDAMSDSIRAWIAAEVRA